MWTSEMGLTQEALVREAILLAVDQVSRGDYSGSQLPGGLRGDFIIGRSKNMFAAIIWYFYYVKDRNCKVVFFSD